MLQETRKVYCNNSTGIINTVKNALLTKEDVEIQVDKLLGIREDDELVHLETLSVINGKVRTHGGTYRKITVGDVEERRSEDWADNERDLWVDAVRNDQTNDGLYEWWEDLCDRAEMEGELYPFDDDSDRAEIEELYNALPAKQRKLLEQDGWGVKGDYEQDIDSEINRNSDFLTFYWGSCGSLYGSNCYYNGGTEWQTNWNVCIEKALVNYLQKLYEKGILEY